MNTLIKIAGIALIFLCLSIILKSYRPEYVFLMRVFAVVLISSLMLEDISAFISEALTAFTVFNINSQHINLLLKVTGTAIITDFVCDTLKDNGDSSLAGVVAVSAKFIILYMSLPIINALIIFCLKFIE